MSLPEVLQKIFDSKDFTAGGGAASALSAAMAASLVAMVCRLSIGKNLGLSDKEFEEIADEMDQVSLDLRQGAIKDYEAFLGIKAAYALPKQTEEEKARRKLAIGKAAYAAADVPRQNARLAMKVVEAAMRLGGRSNANAASDLKVGSDLAKASVEGFLANIRANLGLIKDEESVADLNGFISQTESKIRLGKEVEGR